MEIPVDFLPCEKNQKEIGIEELRRTARMKEKKEGEQMETLELKEHKKLNVWVKMHNEM